MALCVCVRRVLKLKENNEKWFRDCKRLPVAFSTSGGNAQLLITSLSIFLERLTLLEKIFIRIKCCYYSVVASFFIRGGDCCGERMSVVRHLTLTPIYYSE